MKTAYVIYDRPLDYPNHVVVRIWNLDGGQLKPTIFFMTFKTLAKARKFIPPGLVRTERLPEDDPVILESWL